MNNTLFSENMKLADLILTNYRLLYVLPYFDIELGFGEITVKQICEDKKISTNLFLVVCNIYTFDSYHPNTEIINLIPLEGLLSYFRKSHKDYLENRMPKIISQILDLIDYCHIKNGGVLASFCNKYRKEVISHFNYEEKIVFPHIERLLKGDKQDKYKILEYEENHSNIEEALNDLKNIIIKYLPNDCTIERCRDVLIELFLFESDLEKHTLLEDQILITLVENIERKIND